MNDLNNKPASGKLLLAEPFMWDDNFKRTVILLCTHNEDGSFGLVLNRQLEYKLSDALPECDAFDAPLYYGGPVEPNTLHYIHSYGNMLAGSVKLNKGLYLGGDFEQLKSMINLGQIENNRIRFYVGYSGWDPKQLQEEMESNSWIVANSQPAYIFSDEPTEIWRKVLTDMGGDYKVMANFPENPSLN